MNIKRLIRRAVPTFRVGDPILKYCHSISEDIKRLNKKIDELDLKNEYLFWISQRLSEEADLETKKRIFMNTPKATGELRIIQLVNNYILKRVKKICDDNEIEFFYPMVLY